MIVQIVYDKQFHVGICLKINKIIDKMKKQEDFSIYRIPFKCKFKVDFKTTPPKPIYNNYQTVPINNDCITKSPYSIKYACHYHTNKTPSTIIAKKIEIQQIPIQGVKIRMKSAPHRPERNNNGIVENQLIQSLSPGHDPSKFNSKTVRETFVRSATRKKNNFKDDVFDYDRKCYSERKFIISFVNLVKQREKSRHLIDKKLQAYNYKNVLGDPLPFRSKKIPKLLINQNGVVKLQRS